MPHRVSPDAVRVFLALPTVPRTIVLRLLEPVPDIDVVGEANDLAELATAIEPARDADVLLVAGDGTAAAAVFELMALPQWPAVMAIDAAGPTVGLHEVLPRARDLGDLSPTEFVDAIRSTTTREEAPWP